MTDESQCIHLIAAWFWTYWIHSTVFLGLCAALVHFFNPRSYALKAWLWKSAATVPVLTSVASLVLSNYSMQFGFVIEKTLAAEIQSTGTQETQSLAPKQVADSLTLTERAVAQSAPALASEASRQSNLPIPQEPVQHTNTASEVSSRIAGTGMASNLSSRLSSTAWPVSFLLLCSSLWCLIRGLHFACVYRRFLLPAVELQSGELHSELQRFLKSAGVRRRIRLLISQEATQPFAIGILRWTIVVPRHIEVVLDPKQLRALLAHEVGHLLRRDAVWIAIGGFLCSFLVFQPLNFVARRRWRDAAEFLADDWAVGHGVAPLNLVRCLAKVAEWQASGMLKAAMSFANSSADALTRRAERLLRDRSGDNWRVPARLSANLALTIAGLTIVFFGPNLGAHKQEYEAMLNCWRVASNGQRVEDAKTSESLARLWEQSRHALHASLNGTETSARGLREVEWILRQTLGLNVDGTMLRPTDKPNLNSTQFDWAELNKTALKENVWLKGKRRELELS